MPIGTSLEETNRLVGEIEDILIAEEGVLTVGAFGGLSEASKMDVAFGSVDAGIHVGQLSARLMDKKDRKRSNAAIMDAVRSKLPEVEGVQFKFVDMGEQMMGGGSAAPVEIKLFGKDIAALREISEKIVRRIEGIEGLRDLDTSLRAGKPELRIRIDHEKAGRVGLSVGQVAGTIQTAMQGKIAGQLRSGGDEFNIRVQFREGDRRSIEDIENLTVRSPLGVQIPLNPVARFEYGEGPVKLDREDQSRRVSVTANVFGRDLGSIMADVRSAVEPMTKAFPSGYFVEFGGGYEQMMETFVDLGAAFLLAVLLVYMVMAASFESFTHPLVIMFTMPLALIGVVLILLITGKTISLVSSMGVIMLVVTKTGRGAARGVDPGGDDAAASHFDHLRHDDLRDDPDGAFDLRGRGDAGSHGANRDRRTAYGHGADVGDHPGGIQHCGSDQLQDEQAGDGYAARGGGGVRYGDSA
jgi:HAE1 family hydrophobic/amphiphilic exporter-1